MGVRPVQNFLDKTVCQNQGCLTRHCWQIFQILQVRSEGVRGPSDQQDAQAAEPHISGNNSRADPQLPAAQEPLPEEDAHYEDLGVDQRLWVNRSPVQSHCSVLHD